MSTLHRTGGLDQDGLRERNVPQQACSTTQARQMVQGLNSEQQQNEKDEKDKKTYGRTPDGTGRCCLFARGRGALIVRASRGS